ncbi:MAG: FkbM family methyltransferase [Verrucomicrobia bacterium]|nr:FkbM family methyltransferase [Verrucomicrobiota bacterium]
MANRRINGELTATGDQKAIRGRKHDETAVPRFPVKCYSEFGEDRWIMENLSLPDTGTYVDVGCAHPVKFSNTAFLRDRGWTGLAVDANPTWAEHWQTPFVTAILSAQPVVRFQFRDNPALSRLHPEGVAYAAVTLDQMLKAHDIDAVDFLSLDLEGAEFDVIKTLDWACYRPGIIIAEHNTEGLDPDYRLRDFLLLRGYRVAHETFANLIYVRE